MPRHNRSRCLLCRKVIFATREEAHFAIGTLIPRDSRADLLSVYRCKHLKQLKRGWHIGHDHKRYDAFKEKLKCPSEL
jgi:hypothetical protein